MSKITIVEGNSNDKDQVRAYLVKGEKGDPGDLSGADIVDNLTSTDNTKVLSAKQGKVLKDLIDKKVYYFNNVANMKNYNLSVEDIAITKGYYSINDGGESLYTITSEENTNEYQIQLNNNLYATLIPINNSLNVRQFGCKGDGTTDDSDNLNKCFSYKENEPYNITFNNNETYLLSKNLFLYSNKNIDLCNSTIKITQSCYIKSNQQSVQSAGYTGVSNLVIKNGTIDGDEIGVCIPLMHTNNIEFNNIKFIDCAKWTHILDLGGCYDTKIKNCLFSGVYLPSADSYRELIQTDYAGSDNMPYWNTGVVYDNIPTKKLIIENCIFEKGGGSTYPTAIGTHSTADINDTLEDIIIRNNKFYECEKANIKFHGIKNLIIENNEFFNEVDFTHNSTNPSKIIIIPFSSEDNKEIENITIKNNKFYNEYDGSVKAFIQMNGLDGSSVISKNITIVENNFLGNFTSTNGIDLFLVGNMRNLNFNNNYIEAVKNTIFKFDGQTIDEVNINDNILKNCRDYWRNVTSTDTTPNSTFINLDNNSIIKNNECINTSKSSMIAGFSADIVLNSDITRLPINQIIKGDEFISIGNDNVINLPYYLNKLKVSGGITITNFGSAVREYTFTLKTYDSKEGSKNLAFFTQYLEPSQRKTISIPPTFIDKNDWGNINRTLYINVNMYSGDKIHYTESKINIETI